VLFFVEHLQSTAITKKLSDFWIRQWKQLNAELGCFCPGSHKNAEKAMEKRKKVNEKLKMFKNNLSINFYWVEVFPFCNRWGRIVKGWWKAQLVQLNMWVITFYIKKSEHIRKRTTVNATGVDDFLLNVLIYSIYGSIFGYLNSSDLYSIKALLKIISRSITCFSTFIRHCTAVPFVSFYPNLPRLAQNGFKKVVKSQIQKCHIPISPSTSV
jgi:hypothetical protein